MRKLCLFATKYEEENSWYTVTMQCLTPSNVNMLPSHHLTLYVCIFSSIFSHFEKYLWKEWISHMYSFILLNNNLRTFLASQHFRLNFANTYCTNQTDWSENVLFMLKLESVKFQVSAQNQSKVRSSNLLLELEHLPAGLYYIDSPLTSLINSGHLSK